MDDAYERHPSSIGVFQIFVEHRFDLGGTISAQIELEVHGSTGGRHDDRTRRLLFADPAKALKCSDGLPGLECAKHDIGRPAIDGDDLALLVEGYDAHPVPRRN